MSTELTSLQVMRLVHDTEEAAVAPLREVAGESVCHLKPRAVSETCAALLRDAEQALRSGREASSRLRDSLCLSDSREAEAHAALDRAGAAKSALLADRIRDLCVRVDERLAQVRTAGEETAQMWRDCATRRGRALAQISESLRHATTDPSDALSRFALDLLPVADQGLDDGSTLPQQSEAIHVTLPLPPALPWRPASETPPLVADEHLSITVPVLLENGKRGCGYYSTHKARWYVHDSRANGGRSGDVTHWLPLEALGAAPQSPPVATPETLGVRAEPGLQQRLIDAARAQVEAAVSPLRGLIADGTLFPVEVCAAAARLLLQRGTVIDAVGRALDEARVSAADEQRMPRSVLGRVQRLVAERDALQESALTSDLLSQGRVTP